MILPLSLFLFTIFLFILFPQSSIFPKCIAFRLILLIPRTKLVHLKKKHSEMVLHTLMQELIDYRCRWIFKNVTSKQTSFVTNINTVRCPRDAYQLQSQNKPAATIFKEQGNRKSVSTACPWRENGESCLLLWFLARIAEWELNVSYFDSEKPS